MGNALLAMHELLTKSDYLFLMRSRNAKDLAHFVSSPLDEEHGFTGCRKTYVLCQGTTKVVAEKVVEPRRNHPSAAKAGPVLNYLRTS